MWIITVIKVAREKNEITLCIGKRLAISKNNRVWIMYVAEISRDSKGIDSEKSEVICLKGNSPSKPITLATLVLNMKTPSQDQVSFTDSFTLQEKIPEKQHMKVSTDIPGSGVCRKVVKKYIYTQYERHVIACVNITF